MDNRIAKGVVLFLILASTVFRAQTQASGGATVFIGLLDDDRKEMSNWQPGVARKRLIRPAFEKTAQGWQPVTSASQPPGMKWTVAFDGKSLGEIEGRAETQPDFLTTIQTILTPAAAIPTVGVPSQRFAGTMAIGPGRVRRPLVLVSKPNYHDPDGWRRLTGAPEEIAVLVRSAFRHEFPHTQRCKDEEVVERDWKFPDSALAFPVVYGSQTHSFLVQTQQKAGDCGYVDDPNDPLAAPWFFVTENRGVRRFGSFMSLLDAGDYDNDGRSELIFFVSQPEDTDGFVLFDSNLRRQASLTWTYH